MQPSSTSTNLSVTSAISKGARDYQEDAHDHWFDASHERLFAVVADGAGGHGGGAEAALATIESSAAFWKKSSATAFDAPPDFLSAWMENAHQAVNEAAAKIQRNARAVVVACLTDGRQAHWVHAGDSRLLRFHDGELTERTRDDSVVQVLFERGEITEEEMGTHPDQSRLLQSLGGDEPPTPRLGKAELCPGDALILCSDGFWEHLTRRELEKLVATPAKKRQAALDKAVDLAVRRGGAKADNTTAIMVHCGEADNSSNSRPWLIWLVFIIALTSLVTWWASNSSWWSGNSEAPVTSPADGPPSPVPMTPPEEVEPAQSEPSDEAAETIPPWPGHPARSSQPSEPEEENPSEP